MLVETQRPGMKDGQKQKFTVTEFWEVTTVALNGEKGRLIGWIDDASAQPLRVFNFALKDLTVAIVHTPGMGGERRLK